MALYINTNISSIQGRANVDRNQSALQGTLQKLSSGLRINSSKDDASGMSVVETLNSRIRGTEMGIRNANDGISVAQTAEGAMGQIVGNLQRIREITVQSGNASIQPGERSKLQMELDQLTQEISRIVRTSEFNGQLLLSGGNNLTFQVGASADVSNQISFSGASLSGALSGILGSNIDITATGTFNLSAINSNVSGGVTAALSQLDLAIGSVVSERARFGAIQNRFDAVISNTKNYSENLQAARSRIQDTDFAAETANLTRSQILQQASTAMLAQANQISQGALSLLQ